MDYDKSTIPAVYDQARRLAPDVLQLWLDLVCRDAAPAPGTCVVDLGCGTGRFTSALAERFAAQVIGVDPSRKMLDVARDQSTGDRVTYLQAPAEALPMGTATVDLVFMSMAFHHLKDQRAAMAEIRRVLRGGGHFCLRNVTREGHFPHRRFFPSLDKILATELPARRDIDDRLAASGFSKVAHQIVRQVIAPTWPDFVSKIELRAYSTLARLKDADFEAGLVALRAYCPNSGLDREVTEEVDWFVFQAV